MKKVMLIVFVSFKLISAADFFVKSAWYVQIDSDNSAQKQWLHYAYDSLKLNVAQSGWLHKLFIDEYLDSAQSTGIKVILHEPEYEESQRLGLYCNLWHSIWEAEENEQWYEHATGNEVIDNSASDSLAWKCTAGSDSADTMLNGLSNWQMKIPTRTFYNYTSEEYDSALAYTAQFRLKIDDRSDTAAIVCTLYVVVAEVDTIMRVLCAGDFAQEDLYDTFDLAFAKANEHHGPVRGKMGSDLETRNYIWIPRSSRGMKGAKHPTC